jgi:large subunit ribosomal protein L24
MKIKKGDIVKVITGKSRGKEGKVLVTFPEREKILVEGINKVKKHKKKTGNDQTQAGGIIEVEAPIHVSNVMLIDAKSGKTTRVGYKIDKDGKKKRVAKKSNTIIE